MKATLEYVRQRFAYFNQQMFGNRLPALPVRLADAKTYLGMCRWRVVGGVKRDFELLVNTRADLPRNVVDDIIIHEMIHYFIAYNGLSDTSAHGPAFRGIMQGINATYGRNISISHKCTPGQEEQLAGVEPRWHVVARVRLADGSVGVKVLPRVMGKVVAYHNAISADRRVVSVELFLHDNPYFNRFPTSAALRLHTADPDELTKHLQGAHSLVVRDGKLVQI